MNNGAKNITSKLAAIVKKVDRLEKRGHNDFHNYDYVMESDVVEALRKHLSDAGILMVPHVENVRIERLDKGILATIEAMYIFSDGEETVTVRVGGMGYDTPGDKSIYKAMTGAEKYALKQLFLIPTGDDPERDEKSGGNAAASSQRTGHATQPQGDSGGSQVTPPGSDERDRTIAFGPGKGEKIDAVSDQILAAWTKSCEESVAKNDKRWGKINQLRLNAVRDEWVRRQPWRGIWAEIQAIGAKHGFDKEGCEVILRDKMNVHGAENLTAEDVASFHDWMEELGKGS